VVKTGDPTWPKGETLGASRGGGGKGARLGGAVSIQKGAVKGERGNFKKKGGRNEGEILLGVGEEGRGGRKVRKKKKKLKKFKRYQGKCVHGGGGCAV